MICVSRTGTGVAENFGTSVEVLLMPAWASNAAKILALLALILFFAAAVIPGMPEWAVPVAGGMVSGAVLLS